MVESCEDALGAIRRNAAAQEGVVNGTCCLLLPIDTEIGPNGSIRPGTSGFWIENLHWRKRRGVNTGYRIQGTHALPRLGSA